MLNIAIDGFSGAGKSTITGEIAKRLNIKRFDTGAIYRALACEYLAQKLPQPNEEVVEKFVKDIDVVVTFENEIQHVIVNKHDWTSDLRKEEIGYFSSVISPYPVLRQKVLTIQRHFASQNDCIMEGRDIGSVVLPHADVKFFLTASLEVRTIRRKEQLEKMGQTADYDEIYKNLKERDNHDLTREVAPLKKVEDAVEIDASNLTIEQVVDKCIKIIEDKTKR